MAEFISLKEGVSKTLKKGDTVCFEGFTHLIPHASAHEVVRQKIDNLTIIRMRSINEVDITAKKVHAYSGWQYCVYVANNSLVFSEHRC